MIHGDITENNVHFQLELRVQIHTATIINMQVTALFTQMSAALSQSSTALNVIKIDEAHLA